MGAARPGRRGRTRRALVIGVVVALATGFAVTADLVRPSPPTAEAAVVLGRVANGVGKCLDNAGNATTANNRVQGNPCSTAPAQQWSRQGLTIRTPGNRCLEPLAGRTAVNTPVVAAACSTANSQQWQAIAGVLYNNRAQKCLQLQTTANAATAIVVGCNTRAAAQRWSLPAASTAGPPPAPTPPAATPPRVTTTVPPPAPVPVPTTTTPPPAVPTTTTAPAATSPAVPVVPTVVNGTTTMVPVPTTTTPPVPPPFQPQGSTVWAADLTKPDVVTAGFVNRSANRQLGDGVWNNPALPWPIRTEPAPAGRPGRSVPFTLPNDAIRLEVEPNHRVFVEGDVYYFGFAFHLGPDFPLDTTSWQVIEQLHGAPGTGSPPISFQAAKGGLLIDGGANKPGATSPGQFAYQKRLANLERGRWYNVVYRVVFSADPTKSWVDVWLDGQKVLENFQPPCATVYPSTAAGDRSGTYRKQGIYHYREIPGGTMSMAGQKLGTGYAAADPSR